MPSLFDEQSLDKSTFATPEMYVMENARRKATDVHERLTTTTAAPVLVIGADTVVVHQNQILEKPTSEHDARRMLRKLSGQRHTVLTGTTLILTRPSGATTTTVSFSVATHVTFSALRQDTIQAYVATGEPLDKAGSYGAQGPVSDSFIQHMDGCYANVVGFPINRFCHELDKVLSD